MDNRAIIQRSLDYIEENLQSDITAAELAQAAGFSLFHYYRLFQQATGLPVMQYILRRRLLHGVYAMNRGERKFDAAMSYGFGTYPGFYKAFCREFGTTPTEFLEANRAKRPYRIDITKEEHMTVRLRGMVCRAGAVFGAVQNQQAHDQMAHRPLRRPL